MKETILLIPMPLGIWIQLNIRKVVFQLIMIILCEIFFAPAVHVEWVDTLHVYIHEFYKLFAQVCI